MNTTYAFVFTEMRGGQVAWFASWPINSKLVSLYGNPQPFIQNLISAGWQQKASLDLSSAPGPEVLIFEKRNVPGGGGIGDWP